MTGCRSRSVTWSTQREANVPTSSARHSVQASRGRDQGAGGRVGLAPLDALDRHRRERDQRNAGDEDEDAGEMPDHVHRRRAELVTARGRRVRAEDIAPTSGGREAHKREGAHTCDAGQEDGLAPRRLERPREAALESDGHEERRDERHEPDVRRQREDDRGGDESLS